MGSTISYYWYGVALLPVNATQTATTSAETPQTDKPIDTTSGDKQINTTSEDKPIDTTSEDKLIDTTSEDKPIDILLENNSRSDVASKDYVSGYDSQITVTSEDNLTLHSIEEPQTIDDEIKAIHTTEEPQTIDDEIDLDYIGMIRSKPVQKKRKPTKGSSGSLIRESCYLQRTNFEEKREPRDLQRTNSDNMINSKPKIVPGNNMGFCIAELKTKLSRGKQVV